MFSEEINKEIQKLISLYEFAEKSIKTVEIHTEEGVNFPSVNELRYAGWLVA